MLPHTPKMSLQGSTAAANSGWPGGAPYRSLTSATLRRPRPPFSGAILVTIAVPCLSPRFMPTVGTPTLIVTGDTINPDLRIIMESLQRGIHDARRVVIPHAGYLANIEKPAEFNRIVLDWLSKQPAGDGRTEIRT